MTTKARDIMVTEVISVKEGTSIEETLKLLINHRITGLPVIDGGGCIIGVVSEYDIINQISHQVGEETWPNTFQTPINFTRKIHSIDEETTLEEIMKIFIKGNFRRLPVLNKNQQLVGLITRRDLMRIFYYRSKL